MEAKEARKIIQAGFVWANWTEEQKEAMKVAWQSMDEVEGLRKEVIGLRGSLKIYKEENDKYEKSSHIEDFMYEMNVNENGEIPVLIKANGIEHSFGITERDVKSFGHIFKMSEVK